MSDIKGTRLPRALDPAVEEHIIRAYAICLKYEEELEGELEAGRDAEKELVECRIVGYLIHYCPTIEALDTVVAEVLSCGIREDFLKLGRMYFDYLLKPFYRYISDYTEMDYEVESPPPFYPLDDMSRRVMNQTALDTKTAHNKALVRDGFSCMLSGAHDYSCMTQSAALRDKWPSKVLDWGFTVCVYILKEIHSGSGSNEEEEDIAGVQFILKRFGYGNLMTELNGAGFHRLENVLTITSKIRSIFDEMLIWFVATSKPHTYEVKIGAALHVDSLPVRSMYGLPDYVTFTTPDGDKLPLPSPLYLKLHATACEVGDLSGATEYMRKTHISLERLAGDPNEVNDALSFAFRHTI